MTPYKLFLDDDKEPPDDSWLVVRDFWAFKAALHDLGLPTEVSFDFVLMTKHTGADCAEVLVMHCLRKGVPLPKWNVHSKSDDGRALITKILTEYENGRTAQPPRT